MAATVVEEEVNLKWIMNQKDGDLNKWFRLLGWHKKEEEEEDASVLVFLQGKISDMMQQVVGELLAGDHWIEQAKKSRREAKDEAHFRINYKFCSDGFLSPEQSRESGVNDVPPLSTFMEDARKAEIRRVAAVKEFSMPFLLRVIDRILEAIGTERPAHVLCEEIVGNSYQRFVLHSIGNKLNAIAERCSLRVSHDTIEDISPKRSKLRFAIHGDGIPEPQHVERRERQRRGRRRR